MGHPRGSSTLRCQFSGWMWFWARTSGWFWGERRWGLVMVQFGSGMLEMGRGMVDLALRLRL
ncbi:hypothetical protein B0T18DRAFT_407600, partial [Schizothecium vesticola]